MLASANRPALRDILANAAPPPWSLSAFMAYLSQNHCLETLEFTMEAERYKTAHAQGTGSEHVCALWQKLINAYILPYGPREVNLPGPVRDRLLGLAWTAAPPNPSELDEAVKIVYELMNDSVLLPFLESTSTAQHEAPPREEEHEPRQGRTRLRIPNDRASASDEGSRSPKSSFLPQLGMGRRSEGQSRSASASTEAVDREAMTDDSGGSTPPAGEPLTPPTTPPTSDWTFSTSPAGLQRAISAHNNGWKRMSARLGLSRKSRSQRRSNPSNPMPPSSSAAADADVTMTEVSLSSSNPL